MPVHVRAANADLPCGSVHVLPRQPEQFALSQARHRGRQERRPVGVAHSAAEQRLNLALVKEANLVGLLDARAPYLPRRVCATPPLVDAVLEDLAEQRDRVYR